MARLFLFLLAAALLVAPHAGLAAELIVNHSVKDPAVSRGHARLMFTMRLVRWEDGSKVRVFVLPDRHPTHQKFVKETLALYPRQLRRVWDRHLFSGLGAIPVQVKTVQEMLQRVAENPGAIGYVPDGAANGEVRVVHVID